MDDAKKGSDYPSGGNDWEVVSLTASTYAAAPGPRLPVDEKKEAGHIAATNELPAAMFVSGHFALPMEGDEHLLKEPDFKAVTNEICSEDFATDKVGVTDPDRPCKGSCEGKLSSDMLGIDFLDKQKSVHMDDIGFGDGRSLEGLGLVGEELTTFHSSVFDASHEGSELGRSIRHAVDATAGVFVGSLDTPSPIVDAPVDSIAVSGAKDNEKEGSDLPCEAWWKQRFSFLYNNAKKAVTFRTIFIAATIVGLAIVGQRWQRAKLHQQHFRLQFNISSEKIGCSMGPLSHVNSTLIGGNQRSPDVRVFGARGL